MSGVCVKAKKAQRQGADEVTEVQATTQLATTLYPQTPFSQVKNPTPRIRELLEHTERDRKHKQLGKCRARKQLYEAGAGTPYPHNPEAMPRAADFFNKQ